MRHHAVPVFKFSLFKILLNLINSMNLSGMSVEYNEEKVNVNKPWWNYNNNRKDKIHKFWQINQL